MDDALQERLRHIFPHLAQPGFLDELPEQSSHHLLKAGTELLAPGAYIQAVPLVLRGLIKVIREEAGGREVLLYYIQPGESCAMTLASTLKRERSLIRAVAVEESEVIALASNWVHTLSWQHPAWRHFVLDTYHQRFEELLAVLDGVCFLQLDERLVRYLKDQMRLSGGTMIELSHQTIAEDLNTSREVISRLLKQLESKGMVRLHRGRLKVLREL